MGATMIDQADTELADLMNQLVGQVKNNQLLLSEISAELVQEKAETDTSNREINTLLMQIIDEVNKKDLSVSEGSDFVTQLIEAKVKSGISSSEINALLSRILGYTKKKTLTAAEVSALWLQYLGDSMAICVYKYFLNIVENEEIRPILEFSLQLAESHVAKITEFLKSANYPVPLGFTKNDVNLNTPRLFSDQFLLFYSNMMTIHGLTAYS